MPRLTNECPYCDRPMVAVEMACEACRVSVHGDFPSDRLAQMPVEHQRFIEMFVLSSGNLKQIAELTGVSYPTVRSRLDKVIAVLREEIGRTVPTGGTPLDAVAQPASGQTGRKGKPAQQPSAAESAERLIKSI